MTRTGTVLTVGHGTASPDELGRLLRQTGVGRLVDVRRFPGSRRQPRLAREEMETWLPEAGVDYVWEPRLGGRRRLGPDDDPQADRWWRVEAFRAYAAHTRTAEFGAGLETVLGTGLDGGGTESSTALMCSETLWWRCHRRLVADVLVLLHGVPVEHLDHAGRLTAHVPAAGARVTADGLRYDLDEA